MPSKNHSIVQGNIYFFLRQKYEGRYRLMPEISILIDDKEYVPDIAICEPLDFTPGNDEVKLVETPLAVVEILSPKQHLADLISKSYLYFEAGVRSYWLVLPDLMTIYVFSGANEYEAFVKKGTVNDRQLDIQLDLESVFK